MTLLVTGASGLLGSKLCQLALAQGSEVYAAYSQHKPSYGTPLHLDISSESTISKAFEKAKPDAVVHAAAMTDVDKCEAEKELAWKMNAKGTENVAKTCKKHGAFLIYVSTDYVFNGEKGTYKETDETAPINHYGATKLAGERLIEELAVEHCVARTSVIYGSTPATGKTNFALWLLNSLRKRERIKIVTDQWNSPTLNVNLASMILEILEKRTTGIFHLAGATRLSRYEFAKSLANNFTLDANLMTPVSSKEISWTAKRPRDSSLDVTKARQTLRTNPMTIQEALQELKREIALRESSAAHTVSQFEPKQKRKH